MAEDRYAMHVLVVHVVVLWFTVMVLWYTGGAVVHWWYCGILGVS